MTNEPLEVPTPLLQAASASADRRARLPWGMFGEFAVIADTLAALRRSTEPPVRPRAVRLTVFAGDHGIAELEVESDLPAATGTRVCELVSGIGATAQLAAAAGVQVSVLDVAVDNVAVDDAIAADATADDITRSVDVVRDPEGANRFAESDGQVSALRHALIRRSSGRIDIEDALTGQQVARAIQAGRDAAVHDLDAGAELLIGAVCGVGVGVCAAAIGSLLTGVEPVDAAGRGGGIDDQAWIRRVRVVRDARYRLTESAPDAATLLRVAGGADLAALTGYVLQAALRGVPVLLDDIPGAVAAVLAHRFAPGAERYVLVPAELPELLHRRLLELLGTPPLTTLRLGTGTAAPSLLMVGLLRSVTAVIDAAPAESSSDRAPWSIQQWDPELL